MLSLLRLLLLRTANTTPAEPIVVGTISASVISAVRIDLSATAAMGGTAPHTYRWHRGSVSGFTPDGSTAIAGATGLTYSDTGLSFYTRYYYKLVVTDSNGVGATYPEVSVRTLNRHTFYVRDLDGSIEQSTSLDLAIA